MNYGREIEKLYQELKSKHGHPKEQWSLWCRRPKSAEEKEEVLVGAILTQNTNWKNVALAINNLKQAKANSLATIYRWGKERIAPLVRPAGFYRSKAGYLFNLAEFVVKSCGGLEKMEKVQTRELRRQLLALKGIGPETADSILLYGLGKAVFVIDEYTRRLVKARGLAERRDSPSYESLRAMFEKNLKKDYRLYQDFHALIVIDGKYGRG